MNDLPSSGQRVLLDGLQVGRFAHILTGSSLQRLTQILDRNHLEAVADMASTYIDDVGEAPDVVLFHIKGNLVICKKCL
jgi:hypothetical protein